MSRVTLSASRTRMPICRARVLRLLAVQQGTMAPMQDDRGQWWCDQCQGRAAKGGFTVNVRGPFESRTVKVGDGTIYCSERCLLEGLLRTVPKGDPIEAQQATIRSLEHRVRELRDRYDSERDQADQYRVSLTEIEALLAEIRDEEMTRSISVDEQGQRLRRSLEVMRRYART